MGTTPRPCEGTQQHVCCCNACHLERLRHTRCSVCKVCYTSHCSALFSNTAEAGRSPTQELVKKQRVKGRMMGETAA